MADRSPLRTTAALLAMLLLATGVFADVPEARAQTKTTRLISLSVDGEAGDGQSPPSLNDRGPHIAVSADGRYVAFASDAANLLGAGRDENQVTDVFRYDRQTGELIMVSRGQQDGEPTYGNGPSGAVQIDISADGNLVVFDSLASNLTDDGVNPDQRHIYVRDVRNQYTVLASTDGEIHRTGTTASISSNGGFVAFSDDDLFTPVYRVELIFDPSGALIGAGALTEVVAHGMSPSISGDGRFVAFTTYDDLDPRDEERGGDQSDVYLWDANFRDSVQLISLTADMQRSGDGPSYTRGPRAVSDDGRIVAFWSEASDLLNDVSVPRGGVGYVRVRSGEFPFTEALPFTPEGEIRNSGYPQLSRDGAFATFTSNQGDLVEPPPGGPAPRLRARSDRPRRQPARDHPREPEHLRRAGRLRQRRRRPERRRKRHRVRLRGDEPGHRPQRLQRRLRPRRLRRADHRGPEPHRRTGRRVPRDHRGRPLRRGHLRAAPGAG